MARCFFMSAKSSGPLFDWSGRGGTPEGAVVMVSLVSAGRNAGSPNVWGMNPKFAGEGRLNVLSEGTVPRDEIHREKIAAYFTGCKREASHAHAPFAVRLIPDQGIVLLLQADVNDSMTTARNGNHSIHKSTVRDMQGDVMPRRNGFAAATPSNSQ